MVALDLGLELAFADLHEVLEDRFGALFRGMEEPPSDEAADN